jgi:hypothetical protein
MGLTLLVDEFGKSEVNGIGIDIGEIWDFILMGFWWHFICCLDLLSLSLFYVIFANLLGVIILMEGNFVKGLSGWKCAD